MMNERYNALAGMKPFRWYGESKENGWLLDNLEYLGLVDVENKEKK